MPANYQYDHLRHTYAWKLLYSQSLTRVYIYGITYQIMLAEMYMQWDYMVILHGQI